MKKVLIITYYWPPSGGAGVQRWLKFVKYLREFGIEPIVLTVKEEFATYPVKDAGLCDEVEENVRVFRTKSKEPFNLYKKLSGKDEVPHSGFANEQKVSFFQRIARFIRGNFFLPDARRGWNKFAYTKAKSLIYKYNIGTVITTSPPHSTQLIGEKLKDKLKVRWIADLRDPWTDIYYYDHLYHTGFAKRIDRIYEKRVLTKADKVVVVSEAIKKQFSLKDPEVRKSDIVVIPNGFDEHDFDPDIRSDKNKFVITYTGTIAANYNIESFLDAVHSLVDKINQNKIILRFVGVVSGKYKNYIQNTYLHENTEYIGYVSHVESIRYLQQSTVLFLAIPKVVNNEGILTGKLFEYLGAGKPIIGVGPVQGDAARIIRSCKAGEVYGYSEKENIFNYLMKLYKQWERGENLAVAGEQIKYYSRKHLTKELASLLA